MHKLMVLLSIVLLAAASASATEPVRVIGALPQSQSQLRFGNTGGSYVIWDNQNIWRWSGSEWISIKPQLAPLDSISQVLFLNASDGFALVGRKLALTQDGGEHWIDATLPHNFNPLCIAAASNGAIWIGGYAVPKDAGNLQYSEMPDALLVFPISNGTAEILREGQGGIRHFAFHNEHIIAADVAYVFVSTNDRNASESARTWETAKFGPSPIRKKCLEQATPTALSYLDNEHLWLGLRNGCLASSRDGGHTWRYIETSTFMGDDRFMWDMRFYSPLHGYAAAGQQLYQSEDGGKSWTPIRSLHGVQDVAFRTQEIDILVPNAIMKIPIPRSD